MEESRNISCWFVLSLTAGDTINRPLQGAALSKDHKNGKWMDALLSLFPPSASTTSIGLAVRGGFHLEAGM